MSRRESRVSMNVRQNDALFEFESFKKKFLLANKHITKLNSTLSVRIEELNAQISTLYVENLRLRASEIALSAQLKREREKSRKIITDAEAATVSLSKHFGFLRHTFNIGPVTPPPQSPPPSKARRPVLNSLPSPKAPRLARAPNVPQIYEDDECSSSENDHDREISKTKTTSPTHRKTKTKPRLSASRLPLPLRVSPPPPLPTPVSLQTETEGPQSNIIVARKKPSRRQSGLLTVNAGGSTGSSDKARNDFSAVLLQPRPPSPAFGSPIRRGSALDDDCETLETDGVVDVVDDMEGDGDEEPEIVVKREKRKGKGKDKETGKERDLLIDLTRPRERERKRAREEDEHTGLSVEGDKLKLKDVTNSPRSRSALPPLDANASDRDRRQTPEADGSTSGFSSTAVTATRTFISTPATTSVPSQLLTPRASSSPVPPPSISETDGNTMNGRERRTRKSVNYAEPKLNTKMRKPDPLPGSTSGTRKRSSAAHTTVQSEDDVDEPAARSSIERELVPKSVNGQSSSSSSSPFPPLPALPLSFPPAHSSSSSRSSAATVVKRKKSRPYLIPNDDESDGAQADVDAEFSNGKGMGSGNGNGNGNGWVCVEGRRKSANVRKVIVAVGDVNGSMMVEVDDGRRHSMAV